MFWEEKFQSLLALNKLDSIAWLVIRDIKTKRLSGDVQILLKLEADLLYKGVSTEYDV